MNAKKSALLFAAFVFLAGSVTWGYGEGPSHSGRWVYGQVSYSSGTPCRRCCRISVATENGFSKSGCTNRQGVYKIYVASQYARTVYFRGRRVWSGSRTTKGGARVDIVAR